MEIILTHCLKMQFRFDTWQTYDEIILKFIHWISISVFFLVIITKYKTWRFGHMYLMCVRVSLIQGTYSLMRILNLYIFGKFFCGGFPWREIYPFEGNPKIEPLSSRIEAHTQYHCATDVLRFPLSTSFLFNFYFYLFFILGNMILLMFEKIK